jgi:hypothetical protein
VIALRPRQSTQRRSEPSFFLANRTGVTKRTLPYFSFIFLTKSLQRATVRVILPGTSEEPTRRCRLDNHLHNWLARPATLRLCQRRAPDRSNAYTIYRSARDPQNHFATIQNHRRPSTQTTLFAPLFSFGQYKTCTFVVRLFCHHSSMTSCQGRGILPYLSIHSVALLS